MNVKKCFPYFLWCQSYRVILRVATCIRSSSLCRKKYFRRKPGKYFIKVFMRHIVRDKHRPAVILIPYNVKLIEIILKNLFRILQEISHVSYKKCFVIIANTIDLSLFLESNETHTYNV
jgi:hypothetical protein